MVGNGKDSGLKGGKRGAERISEQRSRQFWEDGKLTYLCRP